VDSGLAYQDSRSCRVGIAHQLDFRYFLVDKSSN
jgi:hypothetical protein